MGLTRPLSRQLQVGDVPLEPPLRAGLTHSIAAGAPSLKHALPSPSIHGITNASSTFSEVVRAGEPARDAGTSPAWRGSHLRVADQQDQEPPPGLQSLLKDQDDLVKGYINGLVGPTTRNNYTAVERNQLQESFRKLNISTLDKADPQCSSPLLKWHDNGQHYAWDHPICRRSTSPSSSDSSIELMQRSLTTSDGTAFYSSRATSIHEVPEQSTATVLDVKDGNLDGNHELDFAGLNSPCTQTPSSQGHCEHSQLADGDGKCPSDGPWGLGSIEHSVTKEQAIIQEPYVRNERFKLWQRALPVHSVSRPVDGVHSHAAPSGNSGRASDAQDFTNVGGPSAYHQNGKRARAPGQDGGNGDQDDHDGSGHDDNRRGQKRPRASQPAVISLERKFACPLYKKWPKKYAKCAYNAFGAYPQMRSHLEREHKDVWSAQWCERCLKSFPTNGDYREHFQHHTTSTCRTTEHDVIPLPLNLGDLLHKKVRTGSNEDKWRKAAEILFGEDNLRVSPYSVVVDHTLETPMVDTIKRWAHDDALTNDEDLVLDRFEIMKKCDLDQASLVQQNLAGNLIKIICQHLVSKIQVSEAHQPPDYFFDVPSVGDFKDLWSQLQVEWQYVSNASSSRPHQELGDSYGRFLEVCTQPDSGLGISLPSAEMHQPEATGPLPGADTIQHNGTVNPFVLNRDPGWNDGTNTNTDWTLSESN